MNIAELLHFCLTAERSGIIRLVIGPDEGFIIIRDGEVTSAEYKEKSGEEAFFEMLLTHDSQAIFSDEAPNQPANIDKSTHYLLMEAARLLDETSSSTSTLSERALKAEDFCLNFTTLNNTKFSLKEETITIGRDENCDITVPDVSVSFNHCTIIWNGQSHMISDNQSSNGTYVNKQAINKSVSLNAGDNIQVGLCHFLYNHVQTEDVLTDPKRVIPFTFSPQTQKIQLPARE